VSDYGLDDRAIGVPSQSEAKNFPSSLCVQTGWWAHTASYPRGTKGLFPGGKARPGRDADHSPHLLSTQAPPWRVVGLLYFTLSKFRLCIQLLFVQFLFLECSLHECSYSYQNRKVALFLRAAENRLPKQINEIIRVHTLIRHRIHMNPVVST
jgi:hypothetical protein